MTGAMASASRRVRAAMAVRACAAVVNSTAGIGKHAGDDGIIGLSSANLEVPCVEMNVPGVITGVVLAARLQVPRGQDPPCPEMSDCDSGSRQDHGSNYLRSSLMISDSDPDWCCTVKTFTDDFGRVREKLVLRGLGPGSAVIYRTGLAADESLAAGLLASLVEKDTPGSMRQSLVKVIGTLGAVELNLVMYRCENEERALSGGQRGVYTVPGYVSVPNAMFRC